MPFIQGTQTEHQDLQQCPSRPSQLSDCSSSSRAVEDYSSGMWPLPLPPTLSELARAECLQTIKPRDAESKLPTARTCLPTQLLCVAHIGRYRRDKRGKGSSSDESHFLRKKLRVWIQLLSFTLSMCLGRRNFLQRFKLAEYNLGKQTNCCHLVTCGWSFLLHDL